MVKVPSLVVGWPGQQAGQGLLQLDLGGRAGHWSPRAMSIVVRNEVSGTVSGPVVQADAGFQGEFVDSWMQQLIVLFGRV